MEEEKTQRGGRHQNARKAAVTPEPGARWEGWKGHTRRIPRRIPRRMTKRNKKREDHERRADGIKKRPTQASSRTRVQSEACERATKKRSRRRYRIGTRGKTRSPTLLSTIGGSRQGDKREGGREKERDRESSRLAWLKTGCRIAGKWRNGRAAKREAMADDGQPAVVG